MSTIYFLKIHFFTSIIKGIKIIVIILRILLIKHFLTDLIYYYRKLY